MIRPPEATTAKWRVLPSFSFWGPVMLCIFLKWGEEGRHFSVEFKWKVHQSLSGWLIVGPFWKPLLYISRKNSWYCYVAALLLRHTKSNVVQVKTTPVRTSSEGIALRPPPPHDLSFVTEQKWRIYPLPSDEIRNSRHCGVPRAHTHTHTQFQCVCVSPLGYFDRPHDAKLKRPRWWPIQIHLTGATGRPPELPTLIFHPHRPELQSGGIEAVLVRPIEWNCLFSPVFFIFRSKSNRSNQPFNYHLVV